METSLLGIMPKKQWLPFFHFDSKSLCTNVDSPMWMHKCGCTNVNASMWMHQCKCGCTNVGTPKWMHQCRLTLIYELTNFYGKILNKSSGKLL